MGDRTVAFLLAMNRQQYPKNATTNAVRVQRPVSRAQLIVLETKKIQEMRRQRRVFTLVSWVAIVTMIVLIDVGLRHQQAAYEAAQVCKQESVNDD
jgi:hypothetical protein